jgi:hypothetical protein
LSERVTIKSENERDRTNGAFEVSKEW